MNVVIRSGSQTKLFPLVFVHHVSDVNINRVSFSGVGGVNPSILTSADRGNKALKSLRWFLSGSSSVIN